MEKIDVKMSTDLLKLLENIQGGEEMVRGLGKLLENFQASLQSNPCFCIKLGLKSLCSKFFKGNFGTGNILEKLKYLFLQLF